MLTTAPMISRTEGVAQNQLFGGLTITFLVVAFLSGSDLYLDLRDGYPRDHVVTELSLVVLSLLAAAFMARHWQSVVRRADDAEEENVVLTAQLEATRAEAAHFRAEALGLMQGLSLAIDQQFERVYVSGHDVVEGKSHRAGRGLPREYYN